MWLIRLYPDSILFHLTYKTLVQPKRYFHFPCILQWTYRLLWTSSDFPVCKCGSDPKTCSICQNLLWFTSMNFGPREDFRLPRTVEKRHAAWPYEALRIFTSMVFNCIPGNTRHTPSSLRHLKKNHGHGFWWQAMPQSWTTLSDAAEQVDHSVSKVMSQYSRDLTWSFGFLGWTSINQYIHMHK